MSPLTRRWVQAVAAAENPVTLLEAKAHLRVDIADDDSMITALITAATALVEKWTSTALITQTWDLWLDDWPGQDYIVLPKPPLQSITHIKYYDESDVETVFDAANYRVDVFSIPGRVVLKSAASWPGSTLRVNNGVNVRFVAGYGLAAAVPEPLKLAIKLLVGDFYENRENTIIAQGVSIAQLPVAVSALIESYRNHEGRF